MDKKKNYYVGMGLALGTVAGGALMLLFFAVTGNALWISFTGIGTIIGLVVGLVMEMSSAKKVKEENISN